MLAKDASSPFDNYGLELSSMAVIDETARPANSPKQIPSPAEVRPRKLGRWEAWAVWYKRRVRPRAWMALLALYAVYLSCAIYISWANAADWCSEPKFMTASTLFLCAVWILARLGGLAKRVYRDRGARLDDLITFATEHGLHRIAWFLVYAILVAFIVIDSYPNVHRIWSAGGVGILVAICYIFSSSRRKIAWQVVLSGVLMQFVLGAILIRSSVGRGVVECLGGKLKTMINYSTVGAEFTFGYVATGTIKENIPRQPHVFAFYIMCATIYFSFLLSLAVYYGWLRKAIVTSADWLSWSMGVSACDALCVATNVIAAQNELPGILRTYVADMTLSELHTAMASGFGSISTAVFAALIHYGVGVSALMTACILSAPAALVTSKLLLPETQKPESSFLRFIRLKGQERHPLEAALSAMRNNMRVMVIVCANLIGFLSFLDIVNLSLQQAMTALDWQPVDVQWLVGRMFLPMSLILGIPDVDRDVVAQLIGLKTYVNEMVAYLELKKYSETGLISARSESIATFALAGFSNLSSLGIQLAAWSVWSQERLRHCPTLGMRALVAGILGDVMTACVAASMIPLAAKQEPIAYDGLLFLDG